jgi:Undecaprenyl-phosphate galactose phosphotransferase WbaP
MPSGSSFPVSGGQIVSFDGLGGIEMVNQRHFRALRMEKQILDRTLAFVAFVMLSPFFVVVPLLIKLTSRGPVFYRQSRLGKKGRPIRVWKFRSMYADADERLKTILESDPARRAEWEANFKLRDDPRVTPLGRFLRKTSIDEFPQLFNVFAGDMALVGPRPIVEKEVRYYGSAYDTFASVKPGITGLWQASGRSDTDYARRVALDVHYVLNWSPWMDIWILFRTVYAVVFMRGAR